MRTTHMRAALLGLRRLYSSYSFTCICNYSGCYRECCEFGRYKKEEKKGEMMQLYFNEKKLFGNCQIKSINTYWITEHTHKFDKRLKCVFTCIKKTSKSYTENKPQNCSWLNPCVSQGNDIIRVQQTQFYFWQADLVHFCTLACKKAKKACIRQAVGGH